MKKRFSKNEFSTLFVKAIQRCHEVAEKSCVNLIPKEKMFHLSNLHTQDKFDRIANIIYLPENSLKFLDEILPHLLREDGFFQEWINISPEGLTEKEIVFEICIPQRWTDFLIEGELAFEFEPFHILGPALPWDWEIGSPTPLVNLPLIKFS